MAIEEFATDNGMTIFKVHPKKVKDSYTMRKFQRDRLRTQAMLTKLLEYDDVIIVYIDDDGEKQHLVATRNSHRAPLIEEPVSIEEYKKGPKEEIHHISFLVMPGYEPRLMHVDCIQEFVMPTGNIYDVLNTPIEDDSDPELDERNERT
tara:strand:- start:627 stop:1073 length:447 start_codon:yes stop_codon:yes gene_type:complete